ncbi:MAG: glycosyltransferase [Thermoplasmata archaeon]|nr:glycosyltransferase [Thermoplasmata archaeon]
MKLSVVVITRNCEAYMRDCLDSLVIQSHRPVEVIVVDANSTDGTQEIIEEYARGHSYIKLLAHPGTRGVGRNYGVEKSAGDAVAFMDADAIANGLWVEELLKAFEQGADVVAGKEVRMGYSGFTSLKRVGMLHKGVDITYPSVNLAYRKEVFEAIGGFDPWFKEAEEVDLNYRAVDVGNKLVYWPAAVVYHRARESFMGFFKQSFWYGFGRKELTIRHGSLWSSYDPLQMVKVSREENIWKILRLILSAFGYLFCKIIGKRQTTKERMRRSKVSER